MTNCKYVTKNGRCGLKDSYAYRHRCFGEDLCRCREPMTNADRIRAMSDEELADFLGKITPINCDCCVYMRPCHLEYDEETVNYAEKYNCKDGFMQWLQQPAEEEEHDR